jgi:hypothetical protein
MNHLDYDPDALLPGRRLATLPLGACKLDPSTGVMPNPGLILPSPLGPSLSDPVADRLMLEDLARRESPGEPARDIGGENSPESS